MRIQSNYIYLRDGRKIGTIWPDSTGYRAILNLPLPRVPSATGYGATQSEAIIAARNVLIIQISKEADLLSIIADEADKYQPGQTRREINETIEALSAALSNVETLRDRLVRLGVKTDGARKVRETISETRKMVQNLS